MGGAAGEEDTETENDNVKQREEGIRNKSLTAIESKTRIKIDTDRYKSRRNSLLVHAGGDITHNAGMPLCLCWRRCWRYLHEQAARKKG
ncbi:hypothetical protein EVAR_7758_1 [Eumeta japonica]|uniref:Uncharacterized protein n=1 Tax=Eumeta variegata TaxID=151549 RepID=A0A4C1TK34_EUMVA|nr:hypothetical protein EVAR_7758_1 [Eumeta japonica]